MGARARNVLGICIMAATGLLGCVEPPGTSGVVLDAGMSLDMSPGMDMPVVSDDMQDPADVSMPDLVDAMDQGEDMPDAEEFEAELHLDRSKVVVSAIDIYDDSESLEIEVKDVRRSPIVPGDIIGVEVQVDGQACSSKTNMNTQLSVMSQDVFSILDEGGVPYLRASKPGVSQVTATCGAVTFTVTLEVRDITSTPEVSLVSWFAVPKRGDERLVFDDDFMPISNAATPVKFLLSRLTDPDEDEVNALHFISSSDEGTPLLVRDAKLSSALDQHEALQMSSTQVKFGVKGSAGFVSEGVDIFGASSDTAITMVISPDLEAMSHRLFESEQVSIILHTEDPLWVEVIYSLPPGGEPVSMRFDLMVESDVDPQAPGWVITMSCGEKAGMRFWINNEDFSTTATGHRMICGALSRGQLFGVSSLAGAATDPRAFSGELYDVLVMHGDNPDHIANAVPSVHTFLQEFYGILSL